MEENPPKKLYRSERDRIIAGVAGGIGNYLAVDSTVIRLIFIVLAIAGGSGILIYLLCWLLIPSTSDKAIGEKGRMEDHADKESETKAEPWDYSRSRARTGSLLILIGVVFLLANLGIFALNTILKLWPLLLLFIGWQMLNRPRN